MNSNLKLAALFPVLFESGPTTGVAEVTGLHSGNLGDIIYSLPTAFALGVTHYVLNVCSDPAFGSRSLNSDSAISLAKFLVGQGTIKRATVIQSQVPWEYADPKQIGIDYVLDTFRINWTEEKLHLVLRHALPFGIKVKASEAWLNFSNLVPSERLIETSKPYIVVALTERYRRWDNEYYQRLLQDLPEDQVFFIGVDGDLPQKISVPGRYLKFDDLRDMGVFISRAAMMLGNPSFPYAIAEACKTPRILETPDNLNVHPLEETAVAMHMYSVAELRRRLFDALKLPSQSVPVLLDKVAQADLKTAELVSDVSKLQADLTAALAEKADLVGRYEARAVHLENELLRVREAQGSSTRSIEQHAQHLAHQLQHFQMLESQYRQILESPVALLKRFVAQTVMSFGIGRALYERLSKSALLRAIWRGGVA